MRLRTSARTLSTFFGQLVSLPDLLSSADFDLHSAASRRVLCTSSASRTLSQHGRKDE